MGTSPEPTMRRTSIVLLALCAVSAVSAYRPCPAGGLFSSNRNKCFHIVPVALNVRNARQTCANFGGNPASVDNARDNEMVQEAAAFLGQNLHWKNKKLWLGGNDLTDDGKWAWDDDTPFSYTNWMSGEPNNQTGANCLQIDSVNGYWCSANCKDAFPYVCETEPIDKCADPEGWRSYNDYYYLYYTKGQKTWDQAEDYCKHKGGHLASIHSKEESKFITELMLPMKPDTFRLEAWIGGRSQNADGKFAWSDGSAWNFNNWKWDPSNEFHCVELSHSDGAEVNGTKSSVQGWTASYCDHVFNFLCKKPIDDFVAMKIDKEAFFRSIFTLY